MSIGPNTKLKSIELYRDDLLIALNKAPGLHSDEHELRHSASNSIFKPVHRLDKETSGVLLLAREDCWSAYSQLFKGVGLVEKIYWAGLSEKYDSVDELHPTYTFKGYIGARYRSSKRSHVDFDKKFRGYHSVREISHIVSMFPEEHLTEFRKAFTGHPLQIQILTGARHQIRAYLEFRKSPIVGDPVYNPTSSASRMELHCRSLRFEDPLRNKSLYLEAPLIP